MKESYERTCVFYFSKIWPRVNNVELSGLLDLTQGLTKFLAVLLGLLHSLGVFDTQYYVDELDLFIY